MKSANIFFLVIVLIVQISFCQVPLQEERTLIESVEVEESTESSSRLGYYKDKNGKTGLYVNGKRITEAIYDKATPLNSRGYIVKINNKFGFIDYETKPIIPIKYDSIYNVIGDFLVVNKGSKNGAFNYSGEKLLPIKYAKIFGRNKNRFMLVENSKGLSLLNKKAKPIFKTKLDRVDMYDNAIFVNANGKYALVTNSIKTEFIYDSLTTNKYLKTDKIKKLNPKRNYSFKHKKLNKIIVIKNEKVGMVDTLNNTIIPIENDGITYESFKKYYTTIKDKKKGVYLLKCNHYFPPEYDNVYMDGTTFLQVTKDRKKGLIDDATGEFILPIEYERIYKQDTIFVVTKNKKKGVVNRKGKQLIPNKYDDIDNLGGFLSHEYDGLLKVKIDTLYGLVNGKNKTLLPVKYTWLNDFEDKLVIAGINRKYGLFDGNGNEIQPLIYDYIQRKRTPRSKIYFSTKNGMYGILNEDGTVKYKNEFKNVNQIHDDKNNLNLLSPYSKYFLQVIHKNGKEAVINGFNGEFVIPFTDIEILQTIKNHYTNTTYFLVKKGAKYGIIDETNKIIIDLKYTYLDVSLTSIFNSTKNPLKQTALVAKKGNKYGVINLLNEVMVPFKYKHLKKIGSDGLFKAKLNQQYMLIDAKGSILNEGPFDEISNFEYLGYGKSSKALVFLNGKMKEINTKGKFISKEIAMEPHKGFESFLELKLTLIEAMESKNDTLLLDFVKKIAPSKHLVHWLKNSDQRISSKVRYLDYDRIVKTYFERLLKFKQRSWNSRYFNKNNLYTEDFTETNNLGLTTNTRVSDWAYDDTKTLEKFLRNSIKINGYWISSYFLGYRI